MTISFGGRFLGGLSFDRLERPDWNTLFGVAGGVGFVNGPSCKLRVRIVGIGAFRFCTRYGTGSSSSLDIISSTGTLKNIIRIKKK